MSCSPRLSELRTHARPGRDTVLRLENRAKRLCCQAATSSERASRGSRTVKLAHRSHRGRKYPGERPTVTNTLLVTGAYTWSWGFEVTHPAPQQEALHGVNVKGPGTKLVNLVVDDATDDGIFIWPEATGAEVNGSIV